MQREQLEHLIRAAAAISGSKRVLVIGSQAILGRYPTGAPERATLSMEADLLPMDAPEMSEMLTGSLGELSPFHDTFGYFGDGVSTTTATLPTGWQDRLVAIDTPNTNGYVGLCLEPHDLLLSKYFAGRDKDHEFCRAVVRARLVEKSTLRQRLEAMDIPNDDRDRIARRIDADFDF